MSLILLTLEVQPAQVATVTAGLKNDCSVQITESRENTAFQGVSFHLFSFTTKVTLADINGFKASSRYSLIFVMNLLE